MLCEETMRRNDATRRDCARDDTRGDEGTKLCERMILARRMLRERMVLCEGIMYSRDKVVREDGTRERDATCYVRGRSYARG